MIGNIGPWELIFILSYVIPFIIVLLYVRKSNNFKNHLYLLLPLTLGPIGLIIFFILYYLRIFRP